MRINGIWKLFSNASDFSGNGLNGSNTYGSANYSRGYLDTTSSRAGIEVANNTLINPQSANFFISCWFSTVSTQNGYQYILTHYGVDGNSVYMIRMTPDRKIQTYFRDSIGNAITVTSTLTYNDGKWHYVVGSKVGTTLYMYVDGILIGNNTNSSISSINTDAKMGIGNFYNPSLGWDAGVVYWIGKLYRVMYGHNTTITTADIKNEFAFIKGFF